MNDIFLNAQKYENYKRKKKLQNKAYATLNH